MSDEQSVSTWSLPPTLESLGFNVTVGFDVYGTLVDPWSLFRRLMPYVGTDFAEQAAQHWRVKQVEYAFRRGLMRTYADFDVCTHEALLHTLETFHVTPTAKMVNKLLTAYLQLPAYEEAAPAVGGMRSHGARVFAFSNGTRASVETVLRNNEMLHLFDDVVSVDEIRNFKPDPAVYHHLVSRGGSRAEDTWVISSNPWDVIGAKSAGLRAVWVKRRKQGVYDPWGIEPDIVKRTLPDAVRTLRWSYPLTADAETPEPPE